MNEEKTTEKKAIIMEEKIAELEKAENRGRDRLVIGKIPDESVPAHWKHAAEKGCPEAL